MKRLMIILFALAPLGVAAQNLGSIKGTISDKSTGEPLPFVNVWVDNMGKPVGTTTDMNGVFHINPLPAGVYIVHCSFVGYNELQKTNVVVQPNQITFLNGLTLEPVSEVLGPLIITEKSENPLINPEEPGKVVTLQVDLKRMPNSKDVVNIVSTVTPGVSQGENGELYFRGSRADASTYYVDDMKVSSLRNVVPGQGIGSMAVYTGGIPAKYGDTTGGVVVIETQSYFDLYNQYRAMLFLRETEE